MRAAAGATLLLLLAAPGCKRSAEPEPAPSEPRPPRVGVALGEPIENFESALREAARAKQIDLVVESAHGLANTQADQVARLLDAKVAVLLLGPIVPDVLQQSRTESIRRQIPMIALLRGDGRSGSWVGVASSTLAREAGERAGRWLKERGVTRPRVVVVEDSRWTETTRRVEESLKGLEAVCGAIDLPLRLRSGLTSGQTSELLVKALRRMGGADVLVAGDRFATAGAIEGAQQSHQKETLLVVGVTDDPKAIEAARKEGTRLLLVAWKRADLVEQALDAVAAALASPPTPEAPLKRELACELIGVDVTPPKKDGS